MKKWPKIIINQMRIIQIKKLLKEVKPNYFKPLVIFLIKILKYSNPK